MPVKTLEDMAAEVDKYCRDMGWRDREVPFPQAMALLHEEAAEAGHAWRSWGLADATQYLPHVHNNDGTVDGCPGCFQEPKPEGVGAELADVLIRLLDDSVLFGLDLPGHFHVQTYGAFAFGDESQFLVHVNTLHGLIARASFAWDAGDSPVPHLARAMAYLVQMARHYGIDLAREYERKMRYNRTRPRRHGGKRA